MTVEDLHYAMSKLLMDGKGNLPITVAFYWDGDTVLSDITSLHLNGETVQLNEYDFETFADRYSVKDEDYEGEPWGLD